MTRKMTGKPPFILVHGAWSNAKTWDNLAGLLRDRGHMVTAIDLPGHGADGASAHSVGMADYARRVAQTLADQGPAILVGHSMGGMAISAGAELAPQMVLKLVYVAGFLPQSGQSLLDLIKQQDEPGLRHVVIPTDRQGVSRLDATQVGDILFQDAGPAEREMALEALDTQPDRCQIEPVDLTQDRFGRIPRAYVICEQDRTISPALQRKMIANSPYTQSFALDSGHVPQLTRPAELVEILSKL